MAAMGNLQGINDPPLNKCFRAKCLAAVTGKVDSGQNHLMYGNANQAANSFSKSSSFPAMTCRWSGTFIFDFSSAGKLNARFLLGLLTEINPERNQAPDCHPKASDDIPSDVRSYHRASPQDAKDGTP
jgi:hypothetical protein